MKSQPVFSIRLNAALIVTFLFVFGLLLRPAYCQDSERSAVLRGTQQFDPINFQGRTEFEVSDIAKIPVQLARASEEAGCNYKARIKEFPLHFVDVGQRRFVLVFCDAIVGTHQAFDLSNVRQPERVAFPFLARDMGIGTTYRPGLLTWDKAAGVFEARSGTDVCPGSQLRHVYQIGSTEGFVSNGSTLVLVRVDVQENACAKGPWTAVWEAPKWPKGASVR